MHEQYNLKKYLFNDPIVKDTAACLIIILDRNVCVSAVPSTRELNPGFTNLITALI